MDFCKCIVHLPHKSTLNRRQAAGLLERLVDGCDEIENGKSLFPQLTLCYESDDRVWFLTVITYCCVEELQTVA
ncbi:hypothetical protein TNCV_3399501 [Trichonephila clavipes]|nr:hypothetical protein TNCV_3399501 [Trichonephila clavipes]